MDKFIKDLKDTLERSLTDITVLDEYEVDPEFLREMMVDHLQKEKSQVLSLSDIQVFEGPNISSISITLSVRFDLTFLPDYNIEEKKKINIFLKIPIFDQENKTAVKLCNKEIKVYRDFFESLKDHLDHPIKAGLNILLMIYISLVVKHFSVKCIKKNIEPRLKGPYSGPHPQVIFMTESMEEMSSPSVLGKYKCPLLRQISHANKTHLSFC